jgi:hypothetical protein
LKKEETAGESKNSIKRAHKRDEKAMEKAEHKKQMEVESKPSGIMKLFGKAKPKESPIGDTCHFMSTLIRR